MLISANFIPKAYRMHYIMIFMIGVLAFLSIVIKKYQQISLIPAIGKHKDELDIALITSTIGNLLLLITVMLLILEIGELLYAGFIRIFVWFTIIPIAIYVRIIMNKLTK